MEQPSREARIAEKQGIVKTAAWPALRSRKERSSSLTEWKNGERYAAAGVAFQEAVPYIPVSCLEAMVAAGAGENRQAIGIPRTCSQVTSGPDG